LIPKKVSSLTVWRWGGFLFEIEISQVHAAVRQYVHGKNIFPFAQMNFEKLRGQIPVVPLPPGYRVCRINDPTCGTARQKRIGLVVARLWSCSRRSLRERPIVRLRLSN